MQKHGRPPLPLRIGMGLSRDHEDRRRGRGCALLDGHSASCPQDGRDWAELGGPDGNASEGLDQFRAHGGFKWLPPERPCLGQAPTDDDNVWVQARDLACQRAAQSCSGRADDTEGDAIPFGRCLEHLDCVGNLWGSTEGSVAAVDGWASCERFQVAEASAGTEQVFGADGWDVADLPGQMVCPYMQATIQEERAANSCPYSDDKGGTRSGSGALPSLAQSMCIDVVDHPDREVSEPRSET